jgi:hypothetical protein
LRCGAGWMRWIISLGSIVRKKEILQKAKKETNSLHTIKRRKANLIGHVWHKNCLLIHVIEGKIEERREGTGSLKEKGGYWELKEEALDCTLWRTHFGRGYEPVPIQTTD